MKLICLAFIAALASGPLYAQVISVKTDHVSLNLYVSKDGHLHQLSFGSGNPPPPPKDDPWQSEFYPPWGDGFIAEPALEATHADGNTSTDLCFVKTDSQSVGDGVTLTRIDLKDPEYPFYVTLYFKAYSAWDVIEQWEEIRHEEPAPIQLLRFASSAPTFSRGDWWLTQFHGDYAEEMNPSEEHLTSGMKVLDSKISVRADYYRNPAFLLARGAAAQEDQGEVWAGALQWPGNFQFTFESDYGTTRALCGINPFASTFKLPPAQSFITPAMTWAWSGSGTGPLSRNLHRWARKFVLRDGDRPRAVMLNNWEATHTSFNEEKLLSLFDGAHSLGLDLFLLDDGWFGVKYPRNGDTTALGDWVPDPKKLPSGISYLCDQAKSRGLRFGIWMEPEMVSPKSELFEKHPDWAIQQLHRPLETKRGRNQLVLDLSRPEVHDYVLKCLEDLVTQNPGVSYLKWDANRYLTQPGSTWLPPENQMELPIDYSRALLDIMKQMAARHPQVEMMVCSGGGGRVDFGSLHYFHEFWPSDNTDPVRRVFMQWDYSTFFPAIAISAHVTRWGNRPIKFAFDVAMTGRLGLDLDVSKLSPDELDFAKAAIKTYKEQVLPVVQFGDLYRIESPYTHPRSVLDYVSEDRGHAVLFILQIRNAPAAPARPQGLDPTKQYRVTELNLPAGKVSTLSQNGRVIPGDILMRDGLIPPCVNQTDSMVVELSAQ